MESIGYVLLYLSLGSLPWQGIKVSSLFKVGQQQNLKVRENHVTQDVNSYIISMQRPAYIICDLHELLSVAEILIKAGLQISTQNLQGAF